MNQEKLINESIEAGLLFDSKFFDLSLSILQSENITLFRLIIRFFHLIFNINIGTIEKSKSDKK
ncbi:MAG: hypothetical protein N2321_00435 [Melioribacteraceae bacterium]|nr:hypothetical protein [Melioribacteraceae bacterium]